jgi:hypothetical protein
MRQRGATGAVMRRYSDPDTIAVEEEGMAIKDVAGKRTTLEVNDEVFRQVYESPASLPGKEKWVTADEDVRAIEKLLGMKPRTIGAPLWLSGDSKQCGNCRRETSWLDIVSSALKKVHGKEMIAQVILGDRKFVNVEVPHAIQDLFCHQCGVAIPDLRSFKCHNWAYAQPALLEVIEQMRRQ